MPELELGRAGESIELIFFKPKLVTVRLHMFFNVCDCEKVRYIGFNNTP